MRLADKQDVRYTEMSIWDIHRTQVPLVTLLKPDVSRNIVRSLVGMMKEGVWQSARASFLLHGAYAYLCLCTVPVQRQRFTSALPVL